MSDDPAEFFFRPSAGVSASPARRPAPQRFHVRENFRQFQARFPLFFLGFRGDEMLGSGATFGGSYATTSLRCDVSNGINIREDEDIRQM